MHRFTVEFDVKKGRRYDILDDHRELVREVSIQDFRAALERW